MRFKRGKVRVSRNLRPTLWVLKWRSACKRKIQGQLENSIMQWFLGYKNSGLGFSFLCLREGGEWIHIILTTKGLRLVPTFTGLFKGDLRVQSEALTKSNEAPGWIWDLLLILSCHYTY